MRTNLVGKGWGVLGAGWVSGWPFVSWADAGTNLNTANTAWILTSTALVLFMTLPGLALFYGGLVRSKNVLSLFMQCMAITCLVSVLWLIGVYSIAFGDGGALQGFWGGLSKAFLAGTDVNTLKGDLPESVFSMFQMTFAIITPALVVGGFAERVKFSAVVWFTILWMVFVYGPLCHWVWGGGWLQSMGVMDFAGGTVVHINAGVASLVAAVMLGSRKGFPNTLIMPHNMTMTFTGAGMLWVGWFGFNGGSALAANGSAGMAILVTHLAAATGALAWMGMEWIRHGKPSVLGIVTGMVAGLGTITPASGFVGPVGGVLIGLMAGVVCYFATMTLKQKFKIDDSLDVFPVHGVGGIMGTLLTAVFAAPNLGGMGFAAGAGGDMSKQLLVQSVAVGVTIAWSAALTFVIFKILDAVLGVRVSKDQESEGLDLVLHDEKGYNMMEYGPQ
ncbi:MAG: ammonium transporter [Magnetococcales bacterium]|nr:ammonium transporter [Magnetococcales bacterium]MBF0321873.1 ammonium transporter [Magnetococcales bacterium]